MTCTSRYVPHLIGFAVMCLFGGLVLLPVESDLQVSLVGHIHLQEETVKRVNTFKSGIDVVGARRT